MSRREEVEANIISADGEYCDGAWIGPESLRYLARTLADEVDYLRKENERIKQNHGCARHQNTTQFCVEVAERDAIIDKLLAMYVPVTDDEGNEPFLCEGCLWLGFNLGIAGDRPEDEYPCCPVCGDCVEEITTWNKEWLQRIHTRACEIAGRKE